MQIARLFRWLWVFVFLVLLFFGGLFYLGWVNRLIEPHHLGIFSSRLRQKQDLVIYDRFFWSYWYIFPSTYDIKILPLRESFELDFVFKHLDLDILKKALNLKEGDLPEPFVRFRISYRLDEEKILFYGGNRSLEALSFEELFSLKEDIDAFFRQEIAFLNSTELSSGKSLQEKLKMLLNEFLVDQAKKLQYKNFFFLGEPQLTILEFYAPSVELIETFSVEREEIFQETHRHQRRLEKLEDYGRLIEKHPSLKEIFNEDFLHWIDS